MSRTTLSALFTCSMPIPSIYAGPTLRTPDTACRAGPIAPFLSSNFSIFYKHFPTDSSVCPFPAIAKHPVHHPCHDKRQYTCRALKMSFKLTLESAHYLHSPQVQQRRLSLPNHMHHHHRCKQPEHISTQASIKEPSFHNL